MMKNTTTTETNPFVVFTAGCGGAGKSTVTKKVFPELPVVDPDEIKKTIPGYDPKNPAATHDKSSKAAMRMFFEKLGKNESFVFDGTGKNVEKYVRLIAAAHEAGFAVKMLYVEASLETCLNRNANRERVVPAEIIVETHDALIPAQKVLKHYVDDYIVINND